MIKLIDKINNLGIDLLVNDIIHGPICILMNNSEIDLIM